MRWRPRASVFVFVLVMAVGNLVLYQKPLFTFAVSASEITKHESVLRLLSLQILQISLLSGVLGFVSTQSITLAKSVASILAIINATAFYFLLNYNVQFDRTMIANIFGTDTQDAFGLWHISLIPYFLLMGLLPTFLIWWTKVQPSTRRKPLFGSIGAFAIFFSCLYGTYEARLWTDQQKAELLSRVLPWSYLVNTARYFTQSALSTDSQELLPNAHFETNVPSRKEIVLLVIGESARAENFAYYGYAKDTNPFTASTSLVALPVGLSCSTNTISSTACILTHEGSLASPKSTHEPLPSYLTRHGVETIFRTNTSGPPEVTVTSFERPKDIIVQCDTGNCPDPKHDEILNWELAEVLNSSKSDRIFLTIHHYGSHGPGYFKRVPVGFDHFKPGCLTVKFPSCTEEELFNTYDNTIRYTDFLLADLITQLKTVDADSVMIYVSDHGESLGENGFYVHGTPKAIAPKQQREIPFLVWMSKGFRERRGLTYANITPAETFPHDLPFHSVMGAFGMRSEIYKPEFDIFNLKN